MQKLLPVFVIAILVVGGGAFYGGMKYGSQNSSWTGRNLSSEERQQRLAAGGGMRGNMLGARGGGGFVNGEIIAKDDKSITVKLRAPANPNGQAAVSGEQATATAGQAGSKIVFFSDITEVGKFVSGTGSDLEVGVNVIVNGKANTDGSLTAQSIQIRPAREPQAQP